MTDKKFKQKYGIRYIDMLDLITDEESRVKVFTDDKKLFSYDCTHLTKSGARFFAEKIDWSVFFLKYVQSE